MKKMILCMLALASTVFCTEKMYINEEDITMKMNEIFIETGHNHLMKVKNIHTNKKGIYVLENEVECNEKGWVKHWKCPYCHNIYPEGQSCNNSACPSRY